MPNDFEAQEDTQVVQQTENVWKTYGPPIIGAVTILVILIGGYYLWQSRKPQTPKTTQQVQKQETSPAPESQVILPEEEKEGEPSESTEPRELPQAGFPAAFILVPSALALASGFKLRKSIK